MPLKFHGDALCLSGTTGSKLKTSIVKDYYRFWLKVVTRGRGKGMRQVFIAEMNAGSGELYVEDTAEILLGSAGHALQTRYGPRDESFQDLAIALVEPHDKCRRHLLNVIERRWPSINLKDTGNGNYLSEDGMTMLFKSESDFLKTTSEGKMPGISLFYFDPLLVKEWEVIDRIAASRITRPYQTGTEFLVFFFTSDLVVGRKGFEPLARSADKAEWTSGQRESAMYADEAFGGRDWLDVMTQDLSNERLQHELIDLYKRKLRKWFRFVQPLPFVPKTGQRYDLFCCSNYSVGTHVISKFYQYRTRPFGVQQSANEVYPSFRRLHRTLRPAVTGGKRPEEWKILWYVIKNHIDGLCDRKCREIRKMVYGNDGMLDVVFNWLLQGGYLIELQDTDWPWEQQRFPVYEVDWDGVEKKLGVRKPKPPKPLLPDEGPYQEVSEDRTTPIGSIAPNSRRWRIDSPVSSHTMSYSGLS